MEIIIGFLGAVIGGLLSGWFSYKGSKSATRENILAQNKAISESRELEERKNKELIITNAKMIYLDMITAFDEGFKVLKKVTRQKTKDTPALLPISKDYSRAIASVSSYLTVDELIAINKFYGIAEKIRYDIMKVNYNKDHYDDIEIDYMLLEEEVFKDKYAHIMDFDADMITLDFILGLLSKDYKSAFDKLKQLSETL